MKRTITTALFAICWVAGIAHAQLKVNLDHLAAKASESVNVTLDASMLQLAGRFLSSDKSSGDDPQLKEMVSRLKGILVRRFEFASPGAYTQNDLEPVREQLKAPGWSRLVSVQEKAEGVEIYLKMDDGKSAGLAILAWEPKELAFVHLDGPVNLDDLTKLRGKFGIPDVAVTPGSKSGGYAPRKAGK